MESAELKLSIDDLISKGKFDAAERRLNEIISVSKKESSQPFVPRLEFNERYMEDSLREAAIALPFANDVARAIRNGRYRAKLLGGYSGIKIISEGDSWFQYPVLLEDIIDQLIPDYAIYCMAAAGDTTANIAAEQEFVDAVQTERPDMFLFSAGGNDLLGDGALASVLKDFTPGARPEELIDSSALKRQLDFVIEQFSRVIRKCLALKPDLIILSHGYDYARPVKNGKWLGTPFAQRNIPLPIGMKIVRIIVDKFNDRLHDLQGQFNNSFRHVDLRGQIDIGANSWYDELHPRNPGFMRAADVFRQVMRDANLTSPLREAAAIISEALLEEPALTEATNVTLKRVLEGKPFVPTRVRSRTSRKRPDEEIRQAWRDIDKLLEDWDRPEDPARVEARLDYSSSAARSFDERIIGADDLDEFNTLIRGHETGKSIARVHIRAVGGAVRGYGTGFIVAPGLLLTNNHVLDNPAEAAASDIALRYEIGTDGLPLVPVYFKITPDIFVTSERLDFTLVSVEPTNRDGIALSDFNYIPLLPRSGKALKTEVVTIIQHPNGGYKKIALRENKVLGIAGDFIYYVTDTEPGSSGSPVFNTDWQVAALHHRTIPDKDNDQRFLANRGVRVSSIVAEVSSQSLAGNKMATRAYDAIHQAINADPVVTGAGSSGTSPGVVPSPSESGRIYPAPTDHDMAGVATSAVLDRDDYGTNDTIIQDGPYAGLTIRAAAAAIAKSRDETGLADVVTLEAATAFTPEQARAVLSDRGYKFVVDHETGGRAYYEDVIRSRPVWPGARSGVTIGFGYDLGYQTMAEFRSDWGGLLSSAAMTRLGTAIGVTGQAARQLTGQLRDIVVGWDQSLVVFDNKTLPKFVGRTYRNLPRPALDALHGHCISVLVSLVFNRGATFREPGDRYREMRDILAALEAGRPERVPALLRSMKRLWVGTDAPGLVRRREEEAVLFEQGLATGGNENRDIPTDPDLLSDEDFLRLTLESTSNGSGLTAGDEAPSTFDEASAPHLSVTDVRWVSDFHNNPDTWHLPAEAADNAFNLTSDVVEQIIACGAYEPEFGDHGKLILSIRGARLTQGGNSSEDQGSINITPVNPDHTNFRCLIGVYDRPTKKLSLYAASTVPFRTGVLSYYNLFNFGSGVNANLLPTGCYEHCVGTHFGSRVVRGVLRQGNGPNPENASQVTVLRTRNDVVYGSKDFWHNTKPSDNIHPAFGTTRFSSLGCQTVRGSYDANGVSSDEWKMFKRKAGFNADNQGVRYDNVLTTGLEAGAIAVALAAGSSLGSLICVRQGSRGSQVNKVQQAIGLSPDGSFGPATKAALTAFQNQKLGFATGTCNPKMAELLGFAL